MAKYVKNDVPSGYSTTQINDELEKIQTAINSHVDKEGGAGNQMESDLDMNSNDILNVNSIRSDVFILAGQQLSADSTLTVVNGAPYADLNAAQIDADLAVGDIRAVANIGWIQCSSTNPNSRYTASVNGFIRPLTPNPILFGLVDSPATDNTASIQNCADEFGIVQVPLTTNPIEIDEFTTTVKTIIYPIDGEANFKLRTPTVANARGFNLTVAGSKILKGIHIDGNNTERSAVQLVANDCEAYVTTENINSSDTSSTSVSGIEINNADNCKFLCFGENYTDGVTGGSSYPRLVSIQGTSSDYLGSIYGDTVHGGIVIAQSTGSGRIEEAVFEGVCTDNGVYELGATGLVSIGSIAANGDIPEPFVSSGNCHLENLVLGGTHISGAALEPKALAYQDLTIDNITIKKGAIVGSLLTGRTGTTAKSFKVGRIQAEYTPSTRLYNFASGSLTLDYLYIGESDITLNLDGATQTITSSSFIQLDGVKRFDIKPHTIRFVDTQFGTGDAQSSNVVIVFPTTNLAGFSTITNFDFYSYQNDGFTQNTAFQVRIINLLQDGIQADGFRWEKNPGQTSRAREATYNNGIRDSVDNLMATGTAPTGGQWKAGKDLVIYNQTAAPFRTRCTVSGDYAGTAPTFVDY